MSLSYPTYQVINTASVALEALFHSRIKAKDKSASSVIENIRSVCVKNIHAFQNSFAVVNILGVGCYLADVTFTVLSNSRHLSYLASLPSDSLKTSLFFSWASKVPNFDFIFFSIGYSMYSTLTGTYLLSRVFTQWNNLPEAHKIERHLLCMKLIVDITQIYFAKNKILHVVSLACTSYSLFKNLNLDWIVSSCRFPKLNADGQPDGNLWESQATALSSAGILEMTITHSALCLPCDTSTDNQNTCSICKDPDSTSKKISLCSEHIFCQTCLKDYFKSHINNLPSSALEIRVTNVCDPVTQQTKEKTIKVALKKQFAVSCPICRDIAPQNEYTFRVSLINPKTTKLDEMSACVEIQD